MNARENLLIFSMISIQLFLINETENNLIQLLLYWTILLLVIGNARRIHFKKFVKISLFIRRSLYIWPLLISIFFVEKSVFFNTPKTLPIYILIGIMIGVLFIYPKISEWKFTLSKEYIELSTQPSSFNYLMNIYTLVGAAISEEIFFRYYLLNLSNEWVNLYFLIFSSIFLFWIFHYSTKWGATFTKQDSINQLLFSVASVLLYLLSHSIIPSIIAHLTFNMPLIILNIKKYLFCKKINYKEYRLNGNGNLNKKLDT